MSEWTSSAERFLEQARADDDAAEEGALMNEQPSFADVDAYIAGLEDDAMAPLPGGFYEPECTCVMTEASQANCAAHGTDHARGLNGGNE